MRPTNKWWRMAALYRRFAADWPQADFSAQAARAMFAAESRGAAELRADGYPDWFLRRVGVL